MVGALTMERVRKDVEVLARAGLDMATFLSEADASLRRAVPYSALCVATLDPATSLLTGSYKFGALTSVDSHDQEWSCVEYGGCEVDAFAELARSDRSATAVHEVHGDARRSARIRDFMSPRFGYVDELRMVARHAGRTWGGLALLRGSDDVPFDAAEVAYLESLSEVFAAGMRSGLLVRLGAVPGAGPSTGPVVFIVGRDDTVDQVSVGAEAMLGELTGEPHQSLHNGAGIVSALAASARRYAAGRTNVLPRTRVRLTSGRWLVLHASPLSSSAGVTGDVVVTIEEARPPEIVPLIVAAFELTARERDVAQLVLQGMDTKEIAAALHMSRYTVQDHLKAVFDKADVRSRRELVSRVFFDQYAAHLGGDLAPSGWFAEPATVEPAATAGPAA